MDHSVTPAAHRFGGKVHMAQFSSEIMLLTGLVLIINQHVDRRRQWDDEVKLAIVSAVGIDGATVTQVAQRGLFR